MAKSREEKELIATAKNDPTGTGWLVLADWYEDKNEKYEAAKARAKGGASTLVYQVYDIKKEEVVRQYKVFGAAKNYIRTSHYEYSWRDQEDNRPNLVIRVIENFPRVVHQVGWDKLNPHSPQVSKIELDEISNED